MWCNIIFWGYYLEQNCWALLWLQTTAFPSSICLLISLYKGEKFRICLFEFINYLQIRTLNYLVTKKHILINPKKYDSTFLSTASQYLKEHSFFLKVLRLCPIILRRVVLKRVWNIGGMLFMIGINVHYV